MLEQEHDQNIGELELTMNQFLERRELQGSVTGGAKDEVTTFCIFGKNYVGTTLCPVDKYLILPIGGTTIPDFPESLVDLETRHDSSLILASSVSKWYQVLVGITVSFLSLSVGSANIRERMVNR